MTNILLGGILLVGAAAVIEGYLIMGQNQLLRTDNERLLDAARRLLAAVPGKSSDRTDGADLEPTRWWPKLRAAAEWVDAHMQPVMAEDEPEPEVAEEPAPKPRPSPRPRPEQPATVPMHRAWEESAAELTEQQQWEAEQEARWAAEKAAQEAKWDALRADMAKLAKGVA